MTHFIGAVIAPPDAGGFTRVPTKYPDLYGEDAMEVHPSKELQAYLDQALQPFDENLEAPEHDTGADWEKTLAEAKEWNAKRDDGRAKDEAAMTDLGFLNDWDGGWRDDGQGGYTQYSTYNPQSKWDWWVIGGRWEQMYSARQGETAGDMVKTLQQKLEAVRDPEQAQLTATLQAAYEQADRDRFAALASGSETVRTAAEEKLNAAWEALRESPAHIGWAFPYSIVHPVDEEATTRWTEKGSMGWFGMKTDAVSDEGWLEQLIEILGNVPPTSTIWYIDFHI